MRRLVDQFNAAQFPSELGLDKTQFPLPIQNNYAQEKQFPNAAVHPGPLKKKERGQFKVDNDYKGNPCRLLDIVRLQIKFRDPYAIAIFFEVLTQRKLCTRSRTQSRTNEDLVVRRVKNNFRPSFLAEYEYRDLLVNVEFDGHVCELQLALHDLSEVKRQMHKFYKVKRVQETGAYAELLSLYDSVM